MSFRNRKTPQAAVYAATAGGGPVFSLTFGQAVSVAATGTTVNYGTLNFGGSNGIVIIAASSFNTTPSIVSVTVGGVAASAVAGTKNNTTNISSEIWQTNSTVSGSSGAVSITWNIGPAVDSAVAVYCLQTTTPTASSGQIAVTTGATSVNHSITVPAGGGSVAFASSYQGSGVNMPTLTNATSDGTAAGSQIGINAGHTTATGAVTVTATVSPSDFISLSLAAWSP
jgi:hypothetical protein